MASRLYRSYRVPFGSRGFVIRVHEWAYCAVERLGARVARSGKKVFISSVHSAHFHAAAQSNSSEKCLISEIKNGSVQAKYRHLGSTHSKEMMVRAEVRAARVAGGWQCFLILVDMNGIGKSLQAVQEIARMVETLYQSQVMEYK